MKWFKDSRELEHDRELFAGSESVLGEEDMELFLARLQEDKTFFGEQRSRFLSYLLNLESGGLDFFDRKLVERGKTMVEALKELKAHTAAHFLIFPRNQEGGDCRHSLHPDYFILEMTDVSIEQHQFFLKAEQDLLRLVERAADAYRGFRASARKRLQL